MLKMVVVYYVCEVCGREFDDSNKCRKCEEGHAAGASASNLQIPPDVFRNTLMRQIEKIEKESKK